MNQLNDGFSFNLNEIRLESRAAANAILALQDKIRELETDKENLENHIEFLVRSKGENEKGEDEEPGKGKDNYGKMIDNLEILLNKAEFLEKELRRKDQQYCIDKENWALERKSLLKSLSKSRGSLKSTNSKGKGDKLVVKNLDYKVDSEKEIRSARLEQPRNSNKKFKGNESDKQLRESDLHSSSKSPRSSRGTDQLISKYEEIVSHLTQKLKESEFKLQEAEEILYKSRINFNNTIELLENEVQILKNSKNSSDLVQENLELKRKINEQNSKIDSLTYELEDCRLNYMKLKELSQFLRKEEPKFDMLHKPAKELEENIERLSIKYRDLLQKTRNHEENYPELRNELRQTAFDLEYQSFLLYQQKKNQDMTASSL